ncbi:Imm51 family immunity protein [Psychromonas aquimarina]|uniref:Imm51 family immunity protein n=1 Tax=Psychromonas aquimarina TaxID=444919 RepID=UPI000419D6BB|nr:Imm51 family immunity protein [Psychromonas aquimarina]
MKQKNVYQPFLISSFQKIHTLTLSDMKWTAFERHDFLGDGEDWALLIENLLTEKNPQLLSKLTFGDETMMFCIRSEDKDALHETAQMVFAFYQDDALLDAHIAQYAQYEFEPDTA